MRRDRTFFFADYQGQRQTIGRTVISTVPTLLQRQGIFTEAIAGRVPAIYDPATTAPGATGGVTRSPFPGNTIPVARIDPVARATSSSGIRCRRVRGPPTTIAAWTTKRSIRIRSVPGSIIASPATATRLFARVTRFDETFVPVTPLPDGSGIDGRNARAAEHDVLVVRIQLSADVHESRPQRAADRRHETHASVARRLNWTGRHRRAWAFPAFRRTRSSRTRCRHSSSAALSTAGIAAEHRVRVRHERDADRRLTDVAEGTACAEDGSGPALGAPRRRSSRHRRLARSRSATCSPTCPASPIPARRSRAFSWARFSSSRSTCSRRRFGTGPISRSTSSRTTGACPTA